MKKLLLILIFLPFFSYSQQPIIYSEVIQTDSVSKDILFKRGLVWMANAFVDSKEVIQLKDEATGQIIGNGSFIYIGTDPFYRGIIQFKIGLYFKDGRFKYELKEFEHKAININIGLITDLEEAQFRAFGSTKSYRNREWNNLKDEIKTNVDRLISSMQNSIAKPVEIENGDW